MIKHICLVVSFLAVTNLSFGQKKESKADRAFKGNKFTEAIDLYKKDYAKAKGAEAKGRITYYWAQSHDLSAEYNDAHKMYEKAYNLGYQKYDADLLLKYAGTKLKLGDYKGAQDVYQEFLKKDPNNKEAKQGVKSAKTVRSWLAEPTRYKVKNQSAINTDNYDWAIKQFDKKGEQYIFSSSRQGANGNDTDEQVGENFTDLFVSRRDKNGKWGEPMPLPQTINSIHHEGAAVVNAKGNRIYFTRCIREKKQNLGCDIYYADQQGKSWKEPVLIKLKDSAVYSVGHPALNRGEKVMIFASDMPGGQGGKDLWMTTYNKRAKEWTKPTNLGAGINTKGDDLFPYLAPNGDLYFSTDGLVGMGGLDIFKAPSKGENKWGTPENLKSPINSFKDDYGFTFEKNKTDRGFFTSNRDNGKGKDDIYSFQLPEEELKLTVKVLASCDPKTEKGEPLAGATVTLTASDGSSVQVKTNKEGMFTFAKKGTGRYIKKDVNYTIVVEAKNHLVAKDKRSTFGIKGSKSFFHDFELQRTDCGEITLPEVQYILGSAEFVINEKVNSTDSLLVLHKILVENPTIVAELQAHTDCRGGDEPNMILSQKRAQACVDFLVGKGIDPARLVAKGYGESQPRKIMEGGQELVLGCDMITALKTSDPKKFNRYHQLNRRTTFSVLNSDFVPKEK